MFDDLQAQLAANRPSSTERSRGADDQIVPYADSAPQSAELLQNGTLKTYEDFPHGMPTTHAETDADLLAYRPDGSPEDLFPGR